MGGIRLRGEITLVVVFLLMVMLGIILLTLEQDIGIILMFIGIILLLAKGVENLSRGIRKRR